MPASGKRPKENSLIWIYLDSKLRTMKVLESSSKSISSGAS